MGVLKTCSKFNGKSLGGLAPHSDLIQADVSIPSAVDLDNDKPSSELSVRAQGYYFPILAWAFEDSKKLSTPEHFLTRGGKLIRHPNLSVPEPVPAAVVPVVDDHPLHSDHGTKVQGKPGRLLSLPLTGVTQTS